MLPYSVNRAGVVWGPTDPRYEYEGYDEEEKLRPFKFLAGGGLLAGGTAAFAHKFYGQGGDNVATSMFRFLQDAERLTPMQLLATFRLSSMLSPFIQHERVVPSDHMKNGLIQIDERFLGEHTRDYLSKITGLTPADLATRMTSGPLYWRRKEKFTGELVQFTKEGTEKFIAENIGLLYSAGTTGTTRKPNRFAQAYIAVIDEDIAAAVNNIDEASFDSLESAVKHLHDPERIAEIRARLPFLPIGPGSDELLNKAKSVIGGEGLTGINFLRTPGAFASARLNDLVRQLTEPFPGIQNALSIKESTFLKNNARYAGKALLVYGAWTALENADWLKRKDNLVAEAGATGIYGLGAGTLAKYVFGASNKAAFIGGAAASLLSLTPPFQEGAVPGLATVATRLNLFRAHLTHAPGIRYLPFVGSEYKDFLERAMPGVTSPTTAMLGGIILTAAINKRHFKKLEEWRDNMQAGGHTTPFLESVIDDIGEWRVNKTRSWARAAGEAWDKTRDHSKYTVLPEHIRLQRELNQQVAEELLNTKGFFGRMTAQVKAAFKGAGGEVNDYVGLLSKDRRPLGLISQGLLRFALPTAAVYGLLGGFASAETPEELKDLYEGRQYVPVRKGRWWEMGGCFDPSTKIAIGNGNFKAAEDITLNDTLVADDGSICEINHIFVREHAGKMLHIKTWHDGATETLVTPNHIIPILRIYKDKHDNKLDAPIQVEVPAELVRENDFVQVSIPKYKTHIVNLNLVELIKTKQYIIENNRITPVQLNHLTGLVQKSNGSSIPTSIELNEEIGRLFGYFLAEGNLSYKNNRPCMIETVHAYNEKAIVDDIVSICEKTFNVTPSVRYKTSDRLAKEGCWIVRICSSLLADVFFSLFYHSNRMNDKTFPEFFLDTCLEFKCGLIDGYWLGDGHEDDERKIISSSRPDFLYKLRDILLQFELLPSIQIERREKYKDKYKISWRPDLTYKDKQKGFIFFKEKLYTRVREIQSTDYNGTVYDFEINHPSHLLQAGSFIVHNSPFEGTHIKYWSPHWYRSLTTRAKDKALWGEDEDEYSPIYKAYASEFTYELEQRNYFRRPYPVTDQALSDVPFVGWLLAPIGRLIKPARMMHVDELYRQLPSGETEFADFRSSVASNPVDYMGGLAPQTPISPYETGALFGRTTREWMDQAGLVGYTTSQMLGALTGSDSIGARDRWLESASRMSSINRDFWEAELGGALMLSEPIRRFLPKERHEIEQVNPIPNNMPQWIPAHLKFGDPMGRQDRGELLFPGPGYAAIHPEVAGLDPEFYPLVHRYNILANVASWSAEFRRTASAVEEMASTGQLTEQDLAFVNSINERLRESAKRRNFMEEINNSTQEIGAVSATIRQMYMAGLSGVRRAVTPIEYMVPFGFRPFSKLLPQGTAIEEYEQNVIYGTELSFWDKPWRDWFRPALYTAAHNWGFWEGIPGHLEEARSLDNYFDKLEYYKWDRAEKQALARGDKANANQYAGLKGETIHGMDPYADLRTIMKAVPYAERDYFYAFARESDPQNRERILRMVPAHMRHIYMGQWEKIDAVDQHNDFVLEQTLTRKKAMEMERATDANRFFMHNPLPRPDWIGFNPAVDLDDVKLKVVLQQGGDIHDYGMWESQERLLARKPYINDEIVQQLMQPSPDSIRTKVYNVLKSYGIGDANIRVTQTLGSSPRNDVTLNYRDTRRSEFNSLMSD